MTCTRMPRVVVSPSGAISDDESGTHRFYDTGEGVTRGSECRVPCSRLGSRFFVSLLVPPVFQGSIGTWEPMSEPVRRNLTRHVEPGTRHRGVLLGAGRYLLC